MTKKLLKYLLAVIAGGFILCLTALFLGRNTLVRHFADKRIALICKEYNLTISYNNLQLPSLQEISISNLNIVPDERDTLLTLQNINVCFDIWHYLLNKEISIKQVMVDDSRIYLKKQDSITNYNLLSYKAPTEKPQTGAASETNFAMKAHRVQALLFNLIPRNGEFRNITINQQVDSSLVQYNIPCFTIKEGFFNTGITGIEEGDTAQWLMKGALQPKKKNIELNIFSANKERVDALPYIQKQYGATLAFDTLSLNISEEKASSEEIYRLNGYAIIDGLTIHHHRLSPQDITLNQGALIYRLNIGNDYIELDSATTIQINQLSFNPYVKATRKDKWHIRTIINREPFPAQELFNSLPEELFDNLAGIRVRGDLEYHFLLDADFNQLDSLRFYSNLTGHNFGITEFGATDLRKMNDDFIYTAYEQEVPVKSFIVGSENPHFRKLDDISPLLRMAILQSEDGGFYYHRGFLPGAIQEAIIHDLKVGSFARGGSTITMQLVKNVFLNHKKNIARKLEEELIVWLIEQQRLTDKDRMFEVYLNICEWGPLVYGACEASHYYFDKEPSELTANEAIFLASIIPRPKHFRWSFNPDMTLRESNAPYYSIIADRLLSKGLVTEEEAMQITPDIELKGPAKKTFALSTDSIISTHILPTDTLTSN